MRDGWQAKSSVTFAIELGIDDRRANKSFWDEKRVTSNVWLSIADLLNTNDNVVLDSKEYLSEQGAAISEIVPAGDLLVSFKLTLGRLAFAGRDLYTNEAIAALTLFNERELSKNFLFYFFHFFDWIKAAENDVKLKGMTFNKAKLKELEVHFPKSLSEQKRIVAILDEAFEGISMAAAKAEKNLANACELFESYLNSVFTGKREGWVEKPLSALVEIKHGFAFRSEYFKSEGKYVLLTPGNFYEEGGYRGSRRKTEVLRWRNTGWLHLRPGRFSSCHDGASSWFAWQLDIVPEDNKFLHNQRLGLVSTKSGVPWCNEFFFHAFKTKTFRQAVHDGASGVKVRHTSPNKLGLVRVRYPQSDSEQKQIAASLDDVLFEV